MAQLFIAQVPRNVLFSGYDNETQTNNGIIIGSRNKSYSKLFNINGDDNIVSNNGSKIVNGSNNALYGSALITGNFNSINGDILFINGTSNNIYGNNINVLGNNNTSYSTFINQNIVINGFNNSISGDSIYVNGSNNQTQDTKYNYINGEWNIIQGGFIAPDLSGFTDSGTDSVIPQFSNNSKIYLNGDYNIAATYSYNVYLFGSGNQIGSSASNTFVISNSASITEPNQVYIGPDKDVNIKGKVLPTSLVQDYTPTQQDQTGESGWVTKDDSNLYVKTTNLGWRQIPFDDTYAHFYDTTIQNNPTASIAKAFTFNNTVINSNISLVNNSQITVNYDGLYNIQFSAQVNKSGGGQNDIDIWLRYNGVDVPDSNTQVTVIGNNGKAVPAWNFFQSMTASSYIELMWSSVDTGMSIYSTGTQSNPDRPAVPSIILTINKLASL